MYLLFLVLSLWRGSDVMASDSNVVVIGGGVSGLATAAALHANGINVTVLEALPQARALALALTPIEHPSPNSN